MVLLHVMALFLGPLMNLFLSAYSLLRTSTAARGWSFKDAIYHVFVVENGLPAHTDFYKWEVDKVRNLVVAPLTEEVRAHGICYCVCLHHSSIFNMSHTHPAACVSSHGGAVYDHDWC